ncbi:uncharacterized protein L203_104348 [Cryptococcus depauperatus CBS 7841]|uniref:Probable 26S proteasome regulatory subunit rpn-6.2 n=1 Tax=Cryptococcus depauperatus CBS 7841 TaxID=1295531 RepID=A0A1E3IHU4_9TREE|nr:26S proteasome regulatory subunit N6 [Cryptococcus depauperatus CBS 7841]
MSVAKEAVTAEQSQEERMYRQVLETNSSDDDVLRDQETALLKLGALYRDSDRSQDLAQLVTESRVFMSRISKAKTAKLIRALLDLFPAGSRELQMQVTEDYINWASQEKRVFLRQSLQIKLISLNLELGEYRKALTMTETLLKELKRLDDKIILTEVYLLESRAAHAIQNLSRAKTALTSARTTANSIYCPPLLQAQLDIQSGAINADDKDYKTAYSYFFEAFEGFSQTSEKDRRALEALKYMLLCKIMMGLPDDVFPILLTKSATPYAGEDVEAMKATAVALKERSLDMFNTALREYKKQLQQDPLIRSHLALLYDTLLEQNLIRVIEPYSVVELVWIAEEVGQSVQVVEEKLSQMILDQVLNGILNENKGTLEVHDRIEEAGIYSTASEAFKSVGDVVRSLYEQTIQVV